MAKRTSNTKGKIVSAAWELFYAQGYDDTTIEEIVEKSGTSRGSFYHYFRSKDDLLGSLAYLFDEQYELLEKDLDEEGDTFETLMYLNRELFSMIESRIDPLLISRLYSTQITSEGEKSLLDNSRTYYRLLRRLMSLGQHKGELREDISVSDMVRLYAMCERALICEWCLSGFTFSLRSYSEKLLPLLLSGIKK
ncbi:MAG: TetR/AcrR family transcriptional regulator [Eubacteriaceae bacterium]|nr:TetR/AcrR family transcriptional regulator [Eubacteriaceae bacterium]MCR4895001.1 TetR/AcrR family transcriptional regulator [Eubacteriales bacterium]